MIYVVLDTSIFRHDPKRLNGAFRALARLCRGKKIKLYVPEYVKREFVSQQKAFVDEDIQKLLSGARAIPRHSTDKELVALSNKVRQSADKIAPKIEAKIKAEFKTWMQECGAVELRIKPEHGRRVSDDYFQGAVPFSVPKNRQDIPDSFIWQNVLDLARSKDQVHLVANDGALFKAAEKVPNATSHKTLDAFIETEGCQQALSDLTTEVVANNLARARHLLAQKEAELGVMVATDIVDALAYKTVNDPSIPDDNNEGMITMVGGPDDLTFDFDEVEYYGGSEIGIPFKASVVCELNYAIYKGDFYLLGDDKRENISIDERNKHYYDADEEYTIEVEGTLSVELETEKLQDENITDDEIEEALLSGEHQVEIQEKTVASSVVDI